MSPPAAEPRRPFPEPRRLPERRDAFAAGYAAGRGAKRVSLVDLLDRLLQGGVVIQGQIVLSAADVDLVEVDLSLVVAAVDTLASR